MREAVVLGCEQTAVEIWENLPSPLEGLERAKSVWWMRDVAIKRSVGAGYVVLRADPEHWLRAAGSSVTHLLAHSTAKVSVGDLRTLVL